MFVQKEQLSVSLPCSSHAKQQNVVVVLQLLRRDVLANGDSGDKPDAFGGKDVDPSLDDLLRELHAGNAVLKKSSDSVGSLVNGHQVAGLVQLVSGRKTAGT